MLAIADQIGAIGEGQMNSGKQVVEANYRQARQRLTVTIALSIGLGLLMAAFTIRSILRLESHAERQYRETGCAHRAEAAFGAAGGSAGG